MKQRIYIDNSVFGGYHDREFQTETRRFFQRIANGDFRVFISAVTRLELLPAPQRIKAVVSLVPPDDLVELTFSREARDLANKYIAQKILGPASLNDAYHIAIATANRLDVVVSWNFKHIVNYDKIRLFNAVNLMSGFPSIDIRSPLEMIKHDEETK